MVEHDWTLTVVVPITEKEKRDMAAGRRRVFKIDPLDRSAVRARAVVCAACRALADAEDLPDECPGN
jgi:hypothetical protein